MLQAGSEGGSKKKSPAGKPPTLKKGSGPAGPPPLSPEAFLELDAPGGDRVIEVEGVRVLTTHLDRIYWPQEGITKFDLLSYYIRVAPLLLPFLDRRPAILQRYPRGIGAPKFFQHDLQNAPKYIETAPMKNEEGRDIDYAIYNGLPTLLFLANLGTIEQHPWNSTLERIEFPDWLILDLDPHEAPFENVLKTARAVRKVFEARNLRGYPKSSGSRGIHIYLPLAPERPYPEVARFAESLAEEVAARLPEIATTARSLSKRKKGSVYVDWMQNARGKSVVAPYSVRARPGATLAAPLTWEEIDRGFQISDFTLRNMLAQAEGRKDVWKNFFKSRHALSAPQQRVKADGRAKKKSQKRAR